jgi:hypothetical protein
MRGIIGLGVGVIGAAISESFGIVTATGKKIKITKEDFI